MAFTLPGRKFVRLPMVGWFHRLRIGRTFPLRPLTSCGWRNLP